MPPPRAASAADAKYWSRTDDGGAVAGCAGRGAYPGAWCSTACDRDPSACVHVCAAGDGSCGAGLWQSTTRFFKDAKAVAFPPTANIARYTRARSRTSTDGSARTSSSRCLSAGPARAGSLTYSLHAVFKICSLVVSVSFAKSRNERLSTASESSKKSRRVSLAESAFSARSERAFVLRASRFSRFFSLLDFAGTAASASAGAAASTGLGSAGSGAASASPSASASASASPFAALSSASSPPSSMARTVDGTRPLADSDRASSALSASPSFESRVSVVSSSRAFSRRKIAAACSSRSASSPKTYSSPPASHATAARAAGDRSASIRRIRRITTCKCSLGSRCTSARITTTASPATFSEGCRLSSRSERTHTEAICGMIAAHRPTARTVSATNSSLPLRRYACSSRNREGAFSAVHTCVKISSFSARTSLGSAGCTKKALKCVWNSDGCAATIVQMFLSITCCDSGLQRMANTRARSVLGKSATGAR